MVRYELKKIFSRPLGKGALVVLVVLLGLTIFFACRVRYTDEAGKSSVGPAAAQQLRQQQKAWAGTLDEALLRKTIAANWEVQHSADATSEDIVRQNMSYHRMQSFAVIRDLLNQAYSEDFQAFDYYTADALTPDDAPAFYENRVQLLRNYLKENQVSLSHEEAAYLVD